MTHCAGCAPIENRTDSAVVPRCLEPIVFAGQPGAVSALRAGHASYQCLACNRIWTFDGQRGYQSQAWQSLAA